MAAELLARATRSFVRSLGADRVIDYTKVDYTRTGEQYDWIVDVDAHHGILRWRDALNAKGVYVAMGGPGSWILQALLVAPITSLATGKSMGLLLGWKPFNPPDVATIEGLIAGGKVKPAIDRRYPLSEVADALRWVDDGHATGKVVITM
jgi:NADPH:quinone reductase-like Zn-dependent oxidoreductase